MSVSPLLFPELHDTIIISGYVAPGLCEIDGAGRKFKYDKKEGKGSSGATSTYQGREIPDFKVTLKLWTEDHFNRWDELRGILLAANDGSAPTALDIYHPELEDLGIAHVLVEEVGQKKRAREGDSLYSVTFSLTEYHPPKKAGGTAKTSKAGNDATNLGPVYGPDAKTESEQSDEEFLAALENGAF